MIDYEEDWLFPIVFRIKGSVYSRALVYAIPGALLTWAFQLMDIHLPEAREKYGLDELAQSTVWSAATAIMLTVIAFRTRQAYSRFWEGTGLLHQMKGEWFDTVSNCVTFSISARTDDDEGVIRFRHTIVRLMSLCHASALEEISGMQTELATIDVHGLSLETLRHLKECVEVHGFNKVEVLLHLIQSLITQAHNEGILKVPPPILSRVFQTCSRGYVNLLNTKKITDTKFPFPLAQTITFLLLVNTVLTPLVFSAMLTGHSSAILLTFMVLFGCYSLNFISIELEDPFGDDDNDLPLVHFQSEMNSCLLMLLHWNTDIIAQCSPSCVFDFNELVKLVEFPDREDDKNGICQRFRISLLGSSNNSNASESGASPRMPPVAPPQGVRTSRRLSEVSSNAAGDEPVDCLPPRTSLRTEGDVSAVSHFSMVTADSQQTTQSPGSPMAFHDRGETRRQIVPMLRIGPAMNHAAHPVMEEAVDASTRPGAQGIGAHPSKLGKPTPATLADKLSSGKHAGPILAQEDPPDLGQEHYPPPGKRTPRQAMQSALPKIATPRQTSGTPRGAGTPRNVLTRSPRGVTCCQAPLDEFLQRSVEDFNHAFQEWAQRIETELKCLNSTYSSHGVSRNVSITDPPGRNQEIEEL